MELDDGSGILPHARDESLLVDDPDVDWGGARQILSGRKTAGLGPYELIEVLNILS